MAFDDNYIWEGQVLSRQIGILVLSASDELVNDIEEGSCVWPSEWIRLYYDCDDNDSGVVGSTDCDEQIDAQWDCEPWGQADEWSEVGEYDLSPIPVGQQEDGWREEWRRGPLAALKLFCGVVNDPAMWEALVRRFPAIHDEWEEMAVEDPRWRRLRRLMDPPQWLREKLPLSSGRHYGAWQKWKGSRDLNFADWIIFEFDWAQALTADELFDEVESRLQRGYFDI